MNLTCSRIIVWNINSILKSVHITIIRVDLVVENSF